MLRVAASPIVSTEGWSTVARLVVLLVNHGWSRGKGKQGAAA